VVVVVLLQLLHDTHTGFPLCYSTCTNRFVCLTSCIFCQISCEELDFNWNKIAFRLSITKISQRDIYDLNIHWNVMCDCWLIAETTWIKISYKANLCMRKMTVQGSAVYVIAKQWHRSHICTTRSLGSTSDLLHSHDVYCIVLQVSKFHVAFFFEYM